MTRHYLIYLIILLIYLSLFSCTKNNKLIEENIHRHSIKKRVFIRPDTLSDEGAFISPHELMAKKHPKSYFLEGKSHQKLVALSFDDGPSEYTEKVMNKLNQYKIKATFFMVGKNINKNLKLVHSLHQQGHLIANHSWDHSNANKYHSPQDYWLEQIKPTNQLIKEITSKDNTLYRPPYGSISESQIALLANNQMKIVIWSIDTQDWNDKINTAKNVAREAIKHTHPESIILMHDGGGNRQGTVDSLDAIITHYRSLDYRFVTIDKLITEK
jgi:peptidoglycan/xylan/chitin deacetylase (PgdA/CDA1 family)